MICPAPRSSLLPENQIPFARTGPRHPTWVLPCQPTRAPSSSGSACAPGAGCCCPNMKGAPASVILPPSSPTESAQPVWMHGCVTSSPAWPPASPNTGTSPEGRPAPRRSPAVPPLVHTHGASWLSSVSEMGFRRRRQSLLSRAGCGILRIRWRAPARRPQGPTSGHHAGRKPWASWTD